MSRNIFLIVAGLCAIVVAIYHGIEGDAIVQGLNIQPAESAALMRGSFHIGTMGWLVGGIVILFASFLEASWPRNAILIAYTVLFGIPAFSLVVMGQGQPNFGMVMLLLIVVGLIAGLIVDRRRSNSGNLAV